MSDKENKVINLELERISRLPMIDTYLTSLNDLVKAFCNQLIAMGQTNVEGIYSVEAHTVRISVTISKDPP